MQSATPLPESQDAEETLYSGSDDDYYEDPAERQRQYAIQAKRYLEGKPITILSAQLRGPFDEASGWQNPWRSRHGTETKQVPNLSRTPSRGDAQPMEESFRTVPDTINNVRAAPLQKRVSTADFSSLPRGSSGNATMQSSTKHSQTREARGASGSFQLASLEIPEKHHRQKRINAFMDDDTWSRVQAWRDVVKPEFGLGAALEVSRSQEQQQQQPSQLPRPGRKRPAAAEFLRKALASSKRLKASEDSYSTPATPSPIKRNHPTIHPDSNGTFGPAPPSTASTHGDLDGRRRTRSSSRQEQPVSSQPTAQKTIPRPPLVDYSSSYNTVPDEPLSIVLPDRTPKKPADIGSRLSRSQEFPTSPFDAQPISTFEQRLLSSPKIRGNSVRNPSISWREGTPARSQSRLGTPRTSPVAQFSRPGPPATPVNMVASQNSGRTTEPRTLGKTQEQLDAEFQSQADRSFQFRVKVRKASGAIAKVVSEPATNTSSLAKGVSITDGKPVSKNAASASKPSADAIETDIACNVGDGEETSYDETASTQSEPDAEDETTEDTVPKDGVLDFVSVKECTVPLDIEPAAGGENDTVEVVMQDAVTAKPIAADVTEEPRLAEISPLKVVKRKHGGPTLPVTNGLTMTWSFVPKPHGQDRPKTSKSDPGEDATAATEEPSESQAASSPSYVADLGDGQFLPTLALTFSPLSSFFGNQDDVSASTPQRYEGLPTPSLPLGPARPADLIDKCHKESVLPVTSSVSTPERPAGCMHGQEEGHLGGKTSDRGPDAVHTSEALPMGAADLQEQHNVDMATSPLSDSVSSALVETSQQQSPWSKEIVSIEQQAPPSTPKIQQGNNSQASSPLSSPPSTPDLRQQDTTGSTQDTPSKEHQDTTKTTPLHSSAQQQDTTQITPSQSSAQQQDTTRTMFSERFNSTVGGDHPQQQSPWMLPDPQPSFPGANAFATATHGNWYWPHSLQSQSPSQNPWQKNVGLTPAKALMPSSTGLASTPGAISIPSHVWQPTPIRPSPSAATNVSDILDEIIQEKAPQPVVVTPRMRTSTRSGSEGLDITDSIKPFAAFKTPSPEHRRTSRPFPKGSLRSCLKRWRSGIPASSSKGRKVTFAPDFVMYPPSQIDADGDLDINPESDHGAELPTTEATRSPPSRRGRENSPPIKLSMSQLAECNHKFQKHFFRMQLKRPQTRRYGSLNKNRRLSGSKSPGPTGQRLLPSASQQVLGSPGFDAMALAFIQTDRMQDSDQMEIDENPPADNNSEDGSTTGVEIVMPDADAELEPESQSQDPVASVMDNLDAFIGVFDVEADLRKARSGSFDQWREPRPQIEDDVGKPFDNTLKLGSYEREVLGQGIWD